MNVKERAATLWWNRSYHWDSKDCTFIDARTRNVKFGLVHMLVALCLCIGVHRTVAQNLGSHILPGCSKKCFSCNKKEDCCPGLNCVGVHSRKGKAEVKRMK